jgi:hypothetical protein
VPPVPLEQLRIRLRTNHMDLKCSFSHVRDSVKSRAMPNTRTTALSRVTSAYSNSNVHMDQLPLLRNVSIPSSASGMCGVRRPPRRSRPVKSQPEMAQSTYLPYDVVSCLQHKLTCPHDLD